MYGCEHTRLYPVGRIEYFGNRGQAVRCATGVRYDVHTVRLIIEMIDAVDERLGITTRGGDDDLFRFTDVDVDLSGLLGGEFTSTFEDVFSSVKIPLKLLGIPFASQHDRLPSET